MTGPNLDGPTVTVKRAAEILHCSRSRVFELIAATKLKRAPKIGRETVLRTEDVLALAESGGEPSKPKRTRRGPKASVLAALDAVPVET